MTDYKDLNASELLQVINDSRKALQNIDHLIKTLGAKPRMSELVDAMAKHKVLLEDDFRVLEQALATRKNEPQNEQPKMTG